MYEEAFSAFSNNTAYNNSQRGIASNLAEFGTGGRVTTGRRIGEFVLRAPKRLEVHYMKMSWPNIYYTDVYHPVSWITMKGGSTEVTGKGVVIDPQDIIVSGYMARARVAHMLPHNFNPGDTIKTLQTPDEMLIAQQHYRLNSMREKAHLSTDKPYYYPGETIWFSGQMLYQNPLMADTLSSLLYIDLIGPDRELIHSQMRPIDGGRVSGQITLSSHLPAGNYYLRAYTNWARNFAQEDITYQPLPIVGLHDRAIGQLPPAVEADDADIVLSVELTKEKYLAREKITPIITLVDGDGTPIKANLSVSVTDTLQVASVAAQPTLARAFLWTSQASPAVFFSRPKFSVEYGISVAGSFKNKKGEGEKANIVAVRGEYDDYGVLETDSLGNFWATGLHFEDTASMAFAAMDNRGRPYGAVTLSKSPPPTVATQLPGLNLPLVEMEVPREVYQLQGDPDYIMLQELVVEEARIQPLSERNYGYGPGDKTITEEDIKKYSGLGVMDIIKRNVPGFNEHGLSRRNYGSVRGGNEGSTQRYIPTPLVFVDGVRIPEPVPPNGEAVAYLATIAPGEIKNITVYTNGATMFGLAGYDGVIMVETNRGERRPPVKDTIFNKEGFSVFKVQGYTPAGTFAAPDYSTPRQSHSSPDFRSTLYWNPSLSTGETTGKAEFSFYAADQPTVYRIVLEGLTEDNTPVRAVKYVQVKK